MADLDHFKGLNDTHGHETGDRALRVFAETLRESVRSEDLVCRYGGEEFTVLLPGVDLAEAVEIMERVRETLARTTRRGDVPSFTASFGVAESERRRRLRGPAPPGRPGALRGQGRRPRLHLHRRPQHRRRPQPHRHQLTSPPVGHRPATCGCVR